MGLPLLVRPNAVIPIGSRTDRPDYDFSDGITLHIFSMEDGHTAKLEIPSLDGRIETTFELGRIGSSIHIQRHGPAKLWNVSLYGAAPTKVEKQINEATILLA